MALGFEPLCPETTKKDENFIIQKIQRLHENDGIEQKGEKKWSFTLRIHCTHQIQTRENCNLNSNKYESLKFNQFWVK